MSRKVRSLILALAVLAVPGVLDSFWRWLTGHPPGLEALGEKEGSDMDPNGRTIPRPAPPAITDEGSDMDPDG